MNNNGKEETIEAGQYAIVELMGHKVVAGLVSKSEMLGKPMLRVDVPATSAYSEFTQFYGETAIYCVTFVSEQVARLTAEQNKVNPVSVYVPDLITREKHEEVIGAYKEELEQLRVARLPAGTYGEAGTHADKSSSYSAPSEDDGRWTDEDENDESGF